MIKVNKATLTAIYKRLFKAFGPQNWWPAQTRFEVIVGAILTQNTNWGNVERALNNLKCKKFLSPQTLRDIPPQKLALLIRPAGYFNVKAKRLKNFISFLFNEYDGDLKKMMREDFGSLRQKLLKISGIGPETADSILLYALDKPVFVVDAYTKRILYRHNMITQDADYHTIQKMFMKFLGHDVRMFNEYHALIVRLGKDFCRSKPLCRQCVLNDFHPPLPETTGLLEKQERKPFKRGYLCRACHAK